MTTASQTPGEPAELDALIALALREHRAGRLAEAAAAYRQVLALRPDIAEAHNNLGIVLLAQDKLDEAAARFEQALALRPDYAEAHNNLGNVLREPGQARPGRGTVSSKRSLSGRTTPRRTTTWATCCCSQGKLDEAAARYEQAIALRPDYAEAHNNLGNVLRSRASSTRPRHGIEQALALRPDYAEAHNNLGIILWQQGKLDQAVARYRASAGSPAGSTPKRTTTWAMSLREPGQARRSGGTLPASAGSPARLRRSAIGPGRLLFGRRGLRAWLARV